MKKHAQMLLPLTHISPISHISPMHYVSSVVIRWVASARKICGLVIAASLIFTTTATYAISKTEADSKVDEALNKGIVFLQQKQNAQGSLVEPRGNETALTSLAIMALMAVGNQPTDKTPQGDLLRKALEFVLRDDRHDQNGYFGIDGSRMYGHGITTVMLCEMLGMGVDENQETRIRRACNNAIDVILNAQEVEKEKPEFEGGWRYLPTSFDSDLSVTVWQVMALRAAKNAGIEVPKQAVDRAVTYLLRSFYQKNGVTGFGYHPGGATNSGRAAQGLLALQICGQYDRPELKATADWLRENPDQSGFFFYGMYYYAQAMYQRGEPYASEARKHVEDQLLPIQQSDGSWRGAGIEVGVGRVYATSMAILSLAVKFHYLPIYQR